MKDAILVELAERWEREAIPPECTDGSKAAEKDNAIAKGHREAKRECADTLRILVGILSDS